MYKSLLDIKVNKKNTYWVFICARYYFQWIILLLSLCPYHITALYRVVFYRWQNSNTKILSNLLWVTHHAIPGRMISLLPNLNHDNGVPPLVTPAHNEDHWVTITSELSVNSSLQNWIYTLSTLVKLHHGKTHTQRTNGLSGKILSLSVSYLYSADSNWSISNSNLWKKFSEENTFSQSHNSCVEWQ